MESYMYSLRDAERDKKVIRLAIWLLHKKLGTTPEKMAKDLENSGHQGFQALYRELCEMCKHINRKWQRKTTFSIGVTLLWIAYRDSAYRDIICWALLALLEKSPELTAIIKPYVKPPSEWYVNVWDATKAHTEKLRGEGKLPERAQSLGEEIFVPSKQKRKLEKL